MRAATAATLPAPPPTRAPGSTGAPGRPAGEAPLRLLGQSLERLDDLLNEGRNGGDHPGTLADARARIDEALAFLDTLPADALDQAPADQPIALTLPMG